MNSPTTNAWFGEPGRDRAFPVVETGVTRYQSHAGYWFETTSPTWELSKDVTIKVYLTLDLLDSELKSGFVLTLAHYARTMSANHTQNMNSGFKRLIRSAKNSTIGIEMLINFRATLTRETEHYLGGVRGFLYKWHDLGYTGIDDAVVDLLDSWTLKGNIKGDAVKRLDPTQGPLTDNELMAFNEGAVRAYELARISIAELALSLLTSNTGRRPRQLAHLRASLKISPQFASAR